MHFNLVAMSSAFDASTVNGGAIDGFLHPFLSLDHLLALLAVGLFCALLSGRHALITLIAFALALLIGNALVIAQVAVPFAPIGVLGSVTVLALAILLDRRLPWLVGGLAATCFGFFYASSHAVELDFRSAAYVLSYLATFSVASIGLTWIGLALGYLGLRSTVGAATVRLAGIGAAAFGIMALATVGAS